MSIKLFQLAKAIYEGKLDPMEIWVLLPNGVIFGKMASKSELINVVRSNTAQIDSSSIVTAVKSISHRFTYKEIVDEAPETTSENTITLTQAKVHTGDFWMEAPFAHIPANHIMCWGPGALAESQQKDD